MLVLVGPNGGLGWDNTQTFFRSNWTHFQRLLYGNDPRFNTAPNAFDSGKPPWPTFRCAVCNRVLPADIAHVDHRHPKSLLTYRIVEQNEFFSVEPFNTAMAPLYQIASSGAINMVVTNGNGEVEHHYYEVDRPTYASVAAKSVGQTGRNVAPQPRPVVRYGTDLNIYPGTTRSGFPRKFDILELLKNDLHNLQLLCPYCNTSKGNSYENYLQPPSLKKRKTGTDED